MKRGQRCTHRVEYEWSNGVRGRNACLSLDNAEMEADRIRRNAEHRDGLTVTVTITAIPGRT